MGELDEIRARLGDPLTVAAALGIDTKRVKKTRTGVMVCCPAHNEKTPSCHIALKDGALVWSCFGCHAGGDIFALVAASAGLDTKTDFPRVVEHAAALAGVKLETKEDWRAREAEERRSMPERTRLLLELASARGVAMMDLERDLSTSTTETIAGLLRYEPGRDTMVTRVDRAAEAWLEGRAVPEIEDAALVRWVLEGGLHVAVERERVLARALRTPSPRSEPTEADWDRIQGGLDR